MLLPHSWCSMKYMNPRKNVYPRLFLSKPYCTVQLPCISLHPLILFPLSFLNLPHCHIYTELSNCFPAVRITGCALSPMSVSIKEIDRNFVPIEEEAVMWPGPGPRIGAVMWQEGGAGRHIKCVVQWTRSGRAHQG